MSEVGEAMGTAAEGGLFGRAIEPDSGAREPHPHQPENCLNCGTQLVGAYCHACGQPGHVHRTIGGFMHDLLHGALHFEGKLWRTLPMLAIRPGKLTRRYIEGARARFVSPMALFLFSVFLMFAVFQVLGATSTSDSGAAEQLAAGISDVQAEGDASASEEPTEAEKAQAEAEQAVSEVVAEGREARQQALATDAEGAPNISASPTGIDWIDEGIIKKWRENPNLMLYKLQANSYKFSWLLIPISIPFVWLLFAWRRQFRAYDHAIFVTYSLSFMTLLFITVSLLDAVGVPAVIPAGLLFLLPPIHLYKQLRGAYQLSRFSAFWRLMALSLFIWIILLLFLQVLVLLGTL